jgi:hypothetical protein
LEINWKRIKRGLPKAKTAANDRAPTLEEIRKLVEYPDRRIKPIVYVMCSAGIRLGAWEYLRWKHVIPEIDDKTGEVITAKLVVYAGEPEQYYTFITPEAYKELRAWMDHRASHREQITGESWLMRNLWQTTNVPYGANWGLATKPKKIGTVTVKKILNRAMWEQNLRQPLTDGARRHEFKTTHGFRKFFKNNAERVMRPLNVELLMGHDSGISESYWRPTEKEVLEDYLKATEFLTINDQKATLQKQVAQLTTKNEEENYIIKGKLAEKEKEIEAVAGESEKTKRELEELKTHQRIKEEEIEDMQNKIAVLQNNMSEMSKLYTLDSHNFFGIPDEQNPKRAIIHAYNEEHRRLEPVNGKEAEKILGIKDGDIFKIEPADHNDDDDDKKPLLDIAVAEEDKGDNTIKQVKIYKMTGPYTKKEVAMQRQQQQKQKKIMTNKKE